MPETTCLLRPRWRNGPSFWYHSLGLDDVLYCLRFCLVLGCIGRSKDEFVKWRTTEIFQNISYQNENSNVSCEDFFWRHFCWLKLGSGDPGSREGAPNGSTNAQCRLSTRATCGRTPLNTARARVAPLAHERWLVDVLKTKNLGGGFKYFLFLSLLGGNHPIWLIFFRWVETTN